MGSRLSEKKGYGVSEPNGLVIIDSNTAFDGSIRNCRRLEIYGYVQGDVAAGELIVHHGGNFYGQAKTASAEISGTLQGDIIVDGLIRIHPSGVVAGNVHYGRLAMEHGADLSAHVRNVPPRLLGDFEITVVRGRSIRITTQDITAVDPDDAAVDLVFEVSSPIHGFVAIAGSPSATAAKFTQADLLGGRVVFKHDGSTATAASFDVAVTDKSGASSGPPQTVHVIVKSAA